jgi:LPS export ABC transporter protein LptC
MNKKQKTIAAVFVAILAALIVWAVESVPVPPEQKAVQPANKIMKYTGGNTLSEERDGVKIWEITAETMDMNVETQDAECTNITGKFYQEDGNVVEATAPHGTYEAASKNLKLDGGVQANTTKGAALESSTLKWDAADSVLIADGKAKVSNGDMEASGDRLESSDGFEVFKAIGHAHIMKGKAQ